MQVYQVTWSRRLLSSNRPMVFEWGGWGCGKGGVACVMCGYIYVWCVVRECVVLGMPGWHVAWVGRTMMVASSRQA
jgi:hypothetical protein